MSKTIWPYYEKSDGPELIQPPKPKPYLSCDGCKHFHQTMTNTGGLKKAPLYFKACHHPVSVANRNTSINRNFKGEPEGHTITPKWCPCLPEKN
jgi:hypothetical protein